jgi:hypothetical protein
MLDLGYNNYKTKPSLKVLEGGEVFTYNAEKYAVALVEYFTKFLNPNKLFHVISLKDLEATGPTFDLKISKNSDQTIERKPKATAINHYLEYIFANLDSFNSKVMEFFQNSQLEKVTKQKITYLPNILGTIQQTISNSQLPDHLYKKFLSSNLALQWGFNNQQYLAYLQGILPIIGQILDLNKEDLNKIIQCPSEFKKSINLTTYQESILIFGDSKINPEQLVKLAKARIDKANLAVKESYEKEISQGILSIVVFLKKNNFTPQDIYYSELNQNYYNFLEKFIRETLWKICPNTEFLEVNPDKSWKKRVYKLKCELNQNKSD